jgi:hypothetical protein
MLGVGRRKDSEWDIKNIRLCVLGSGIWATFCFILQWGI